MQALPAPPLPFTLLLLLLSFLSHATASLNLVFVTVDDLRLEREVATPNIDFLASHGTDLANAHANVALCGPSRASFLTGLYPRSLCYYHHKLDAEKGADAAALDRGNCGTLPRYLRQNGYRTFGAGKVFHLSRHSEEQFGAGNFLVTKSESCSKQKLFCEIKESEAEDQVAFKWGRGKMEEAIKDGEPFAFFFGLRKPHMPFRLPPAAWDDVGGIKGGEYPDYLPPLRNNVRPEPRALSNYYCSAMKNYAEVNAFGATTQLEADPYPEELALAVRKGYFAAVKWADRVVGKLVTFLQAEGVMNQTVIIVTSDNGMLLGEHGNWCKQSNYDIGTKVPLIVYDPPSAYLGRRQTDELVSLVDLYPTTIDLLGLPPRSCLEGVSRGGIIRGVQEERHNNSRFAFSLAARCVVYNKGKRRLESCRSIKALNFMGYSVRTSRWRYTEWRAVVGNGCKRVVDWDSDPLEAELYDHVDTLLYKPGESENLNLFANELFNGDSFLNEVMTTLKKALVFHYKEACDGEPGCGLASLTIPQQQDARLYLLSPTASPTTASPTPPPSFSPTVSPSPPPTFTPTQHPVAPTIAPTSRPTSKEETIAPTSLPSSEPTVEVVTGIPTQLPIETSVPSIQPSRKASLSPTISPSIVSVNPEANIQGEEEVDVMFISGITAGSIMLILVLGFLLTRGGKESPIQQWNPLDF